MFLHFFKFSTIIASKRQDFQKNFYLREPKKKLFKINNNQKEKMKRQIMLLSACTAALLSACSSNTRIANEVYAPVAQNELRAPATPLVTIDPYTSG